MKASSTTAASIPGRRPLRPAEVRSANARWVEASAADAPASAPRERERRRAYAPSAPPTIIRAARLGACVRFGAPGALSARSSPSARTCKPRRCRRDLREPEVGPARHLPRHQRRRSHAAQAAQRAERGSRHDPGFRPHAVCSCSTAIRRGLCAFTPITWIGASGTPSCGAAWPRAAFSVASHCRSAARKCA